MAKLADDKLMRDIFAECYEDSAKDSAIVSRQANPIKVIKKDLRLITKGVNIALKGVKDLMKHLSGFLTESSKSYTNYKIRLKYITEQYLRAEARSEFYRQQLEMNGNNVEEPTEEYMQDYINMHCIQPTDGAKKLLKGIKLKCDKETLSIMCDDLKDQDLIEKETSMDLFISIFKGNIITDKIIWKGRINELVGFMKDLKPYMDSDSKKHIWQKTSSIFVNKNGLEYTPSQLDKTTASRSGRIDDIKSYFN